MELIIVIVVIGILAAIILVAYNGITSQAHTSAVKSDLASAKKKLEIYKVKHGAYPTSATTLKEAGLKFTEGSYDVTRNNVYYVADTDGKWYAIGAIAQGKAHCLESGQFVENGGSACNSYGHTRENVLAQADADGVDPDTVTTYSTAGFDFPGDGYGNGWNSWAE